MSRQTVTTTTKHEQSPSPTQDIYMVMLCGGRTLASATPFRFAFHFISTQTAACSCGGERSYRCTISIDVDIDGDDVLIRWLSWTTVFSGRVSGCSRGRVAGAGHSKQDSSHCSRHRRADWPRTTSRTLYRTRRISSRPSPPRRRSTTPTTTIRRRTTRPLRRGPSAHVLQATQAHPCR